MSLWEPEEVYTVECSDCGKPKRPHEMEQSETIKICIECTEKVLKILDEGDAMITSVKAWEESMKIIRRISN